MRYETKNQIKLLIETIRLCAAHSLRDNSTLINDTKTLTGGNNINVVIGSNDTEVKQFEFRCDRIGVNLCYDISCMEVILLVRHEGIALEGSNSQERNDECLLEIMHRVQIDEENDIDNYCFIGGAFEFSEDGIDVVCETSEVCSNYVVASNVMTGFTKRFDNKKTITMLVKQKME